VKRAQRILVIDDDFSAFDRVPLASGPDGRFEVERATTGAGGLARYRKSSFDLVVTELRLADMDGLELVRELLLVDPAARIVVLTRDGSVPRAVEAIKAGAVDFAPKTVGPAELRAWLDRALVNVAAPIVEKHLRAAAAGEDGPAGVVGLSEPMREVYALVRSVAGSEANILIVGETGTGKELIARAIHAGSARSAGELVTVNCAAVPRGLFENELFGHERGAFTGADRAKRGLIGAASRGSLLLDEIGAMPLELQPKLLRVLQDREYVPVGGLTPRPADFRLISSTNRPPRDLVREGLFREDLFYRISTVTIALPPLRERPEDLAPLADDFLRLFAQRYKKPTVGFTDAARGAMASYPWPGNLRELRNVIERSVLLARGPTVEFVGLPAGGAASRSS
jgi:two-component system, NtrC family, response regulator HydG